jgi:hypothetical protein
MLLPRRITLATLTFLATVAPCTVRAADDAPSPVARILEDNAAELLARLTNPTGDPGQGFVETDDVFSGTAAIKIVPMQRFEPRIPGWAYKITEHPGLGEYRFVRFAWRADRACTGTMLQLHTLTDWNIRYVAGRDEPGWGSKQIAEKPPARWTVVTRDLFADFGEHTIRGIAFTAFSGQAAWFDHVYFGRSVADLDRIDATEAPEHPAPLDEKALSRHWSDLCSDNAATAYRGRCALLRDPEHAVPFLKHTAETLPASAAELSRQIAQWIDDLGAEDPAARRVAADQLTRHLDAAAGLLRVASTDDASPEVRTAAARLLREKDSRGPWPDPAEQAVRLLRLIDTEKSRDAMQSLAEGAGGPRVAELARAAVAEK